MDIVTLYPSVAALAGVRPEQVRIVAELTDEGATVPFIARYRKERTGNLDEVAVARILEELAAVTEREKRRAFVIDSIEGQGKLSPELKKRIEAAVTLAEIEDLKLPYKVGRTTLAAKA